VIKEQLGRHWQAKVYGSAANSFGTERSDLDITIVLMQGGRSDKPSTGVSDPLRVLYQRRLHSRFLTIVEFVDKGKVPVLKLKYNGIHDVDITVNNHHALANTQLLRAYSGIDPKVKLLVIAVKEWAENNKVCGARDGHLSSYSFTLLTLFFLQVHTQLPVLDGDKAARDLADLRWPCILSKEELFDHFLKFYAEEFKWGDEVVSVRLGKLLPATAVDFCDLPNCSSKRLHIEDPLLPQINLNHVLRFEETLKNTLISSAGSSITVRGSQSVVESCQQYAERCKRGTKIRMT